MNRRKFLMLTLSLVFSLFTLSSANALDYSFTGNFTNDNDVQLFSFTVGATSNVVLETWSYAGGVNAAGQTIARGGFDPILAVFNSTGALVGQNDDGGPSYRAVDLSGAAWDSYLNLTTLVADNYTVAVMQYNNFAWSSNLSDGFEHDSAYDPSGANFTRVLTGHNSGLFWDVSGSAYNSRNGNWAFDILGVEQASTAVPEPATMLLLGSGLIGLAGYGRKKFFKK